MQVKKYITRLPVNMLLLVTLITLSCIIDTNNVQAKKTNIVSINTITLVSKDDEELYDDDYDDDDYDDDDYDDDDYDADDDYDFYNNDFKAYSNGKASSYKFSFTTKSKLILMIPIEVKVLDDDCEKGGFKIQLINEKGDLLQNDSFSLKGFKEGSSTSTWFYADNYFVKPGNYTYKIINTTDNRIKITYSVKGFSDYAKKANVSKNVKKKSCQWIKVGQIDKNNFPYIKSLKCSKKGLIDGWYTDSNGKIYVYTWKIGTGTITTTLKNGKKYKTKLTVTACDPDFFAQLTEYNTRDNYFTVWFKNLNPDPIKILPTGAYSEEDDYKIYDRKLALPKNKAVTIKSGHTKAVKFKVKGNLTWYDYKDHTVYYYFNYCGKKYLGRAWFDGSSFKKGKKWYTTYWDSEAYENWL